jgi:purine-binding chemotaxis protein CheW
VSAARPSALAVTRVGGLHVGFALDTVDEVLMGAAVTPVPLAAPGDAGLINVRGEILTVVDLAVVLGRPPAATHRRRAAHVVVRTGRGRAAIAVDEVGESNRCVPGRARTASSNVRRDTTFPERVIACARPGS